MYARLSGVYIALGRFAPESRDTQGLNQRLASRGANKVHTWYLLAGGGSANINLLRSKDSVSDCIDGTQLLKPPMALDVALSHDMIPPHRGGRRRYIAWHACVIHGRISSWTYSRFACIGSSSKRRTTRPPGLSGHTGARDVNFSTSCPASR